MAIARVQTATGLITSGTSNPITVSATGAHNLGVITSTENADDIASISGGGTWVEGVAQAFANYGASLWYCEDLSAGVTTITITYASSTRGNARFIEYSGVKNTGALSGTANNWSPADPGNTAPAVGPATPSAGPFLGVAVVAHKTGATVVSGPTGGFSVVGANLGAPTQPVNDTWELIGSSPSALTPGATFDVTSDWDASLAFFLGTTGTPPPAATGRFFGGGFF